MADNTFDFVKIGLTESVIASIHDSELVSLQAELDLLTLQNQSMMKYTKKIEAEFEDIAGHPCPGPTVEMDDLWETFESLNRMLVATRRNCDEMRELQDLKDDLQASFPGRKQFLEKVKKLLLDDRYDPNAKELMTKLDAASSELQYAKTTHAAVARELAELNSNIQEQDRRHQDEVTKIRLEMDSIDREFAEEHKYSESPIEDEVAAETAILDKKLKELGKLLRGDVDDDDESSISGTILLPDQTEMPIIEIMTTDLEDFFKNPNDFDLTPLSTVQPPKKPSKPQQSKKKEIGIGQQSSPGSKSAKRIKLAHQSETEESDSRQQPTIEGKSPSVSPPRPPRNSPNLRLRPIKPIPTFKPVPAAIKPIPATIKPIPPAIKPIPVAIKPIPAFKPTPAAIKTYSAIKPIPAAIKPIQAEPEIKEIDDGQQSSLKAGSAGAVQEETPIPMNESFDSASHKDQEMDSTKNDEMDKIFDDDDDQLQSGHNSFASNNNDMSFSDDGKENADFGCFNDGDKSTSSGFDFFGDDGKSDFDFFGPSKISSDDKNPSSLF